MKCYVKHNTTKKRGFKNKMRRIVKNASDHETHIVSTEIQVNAIFNSLKMNLKGKCHEIFTIVFPRF